MWTSSHSNYSLSQINKYPFPVPIWEYLKIRIHFVRLYFISINRVTIFVRVQNLKYIISALRHNRFENTFVIVRQTFSKATTALRTTDCVYCTLEYSLYEVGRGGGNAVVLPLSHWHLISYTTTNVWSPILMYFTMQWISIVLSQGAWFTFRWISSDVWGATAILEEFILLDMR